jgi:uncharacterized protein (UPF0332 family)
MNGDRDIQSIIEKAEEKLRTAKLLLSKNCFDDAVSRTYYAVFHAITAVLFQKGLFFSSHAQTIGAFNKEFVHTGIFDKSFIRIINSLFENRQIGDYDVRSSIDLETAKQSVHDAEVILSGIKIFLAKN